jgi:hypothetical protein
VFSVSHQAVLLTEHLTPYSLVQQKQHQHLHNVSLSQSRLVFTSKNTETDLLSQTVRGIKTLDFAGTKEVIYERSDWPLAKLQDYFKNDTLALIGYGSQGHGQGLNARDNGLNVIVGVRKDGESWRQAKEDGWVHSYLFSSFG